MGQPIKSSLDVKSYFSAELTHIFENIWDKVSVELGVNYISPNIFLYYTLTEPNCFLFRAINAFLNTYDLSNIAETYSKKVKKEIESNKAITGLSVKTKQFTKEFDHFLLKANEERLKLKNDLITSDHIALAILFEEKKLGDGNKINLSYERLFEISKKLHTLTETYEEDDNNDADDIPFPEELVGNFSELPPGVQIMPVIGNMPFEIKFTETPNIKKTRRAVSDGVKKIPFCTNLNATFKGKIIGREKEIRKVIDVLGRKKQNNVVLVGESGVGKTSIVEGLVSLINSKNCPPYLSDAIVFKFNSIELMSGVKLQGMFEERINAMIKGLKANKNYILFIDDFHLILNNKGHEGNDFISGLSEAFRDGDIKIIATCNENGYRSGFEKTELSKIFQKINVEKPTDEECHDILFGIKPDYEDFHKVNYTDDAIELAFTLSKRYITEKTVPLSTIDILDDAGSNKFHEAYYPKIINDYKNDIEGLIEEKEKYLAKDNMKMVEKIDSDIKGIEVMICEKTEELMSKNRLGTVTADDIYNTLSEYTGISIAKLTSNDKETIKNIDKTLKSIVIGQEEALNDISMAIKRSKVGLFPSNRPLASFLCVGTSGCGKTLTAKTLAKEIFGDEKYLVRFDMSEYADKTSVNKLIGASAGYIGYDKGGLLTEAVKKNKHCVLLIDEIEKANEEIYNLFLQVLDEGFLTDNVGYKVDFKNTIIIFTSNVGTKKALSSKTIGFDVDENIDRHDIIEGEVKKKFPPEFINRLDKIVYFNTLTEENIKDIISLELNKLAKRVENIKYKLSYDKETVSYLHSKLKKEEGFGARPIVRLIQTEIENKITDVILDNDFEEGTGLILMAENNILNLKKAEN